MNNDRHYFDCSPPLQGRGRNQRGYTAVEVLLAMTVMAIGAAGVMSMESGAVQGDMEARRLDVANAIARTWVERLRRDSTVWTTPSASVPLVNNCPLASFCPQAVACAAPPAGWYQPPIPTTYPADGLSPMFDALGRDLVAGDVSKAVYCVVIKVDSIVQNGAYNNTGASAAPPELMRATVVVFWPKQLVWGASAVPQCPGFANPIAPNDPVSIENATPGTYHFAFASTPLMKNLL
jgi:prepilin-type N-terminal cleavage/methylation domain-containing protein